MAGDTYVGELTNFVSHGNVSKRNFYDKDPLLSLTFPYNFTICVGVSLNQGILILMSKEGLKKIMIIGPIFSMFSFQEIYCALGGSFKVHNAT